MPESLRVITVNLFFKVAKYKEVFLTVTAEANKIDGALAERFNERPSEYTPTTENMPAMQSGKK